MNFKNKQIIQIILIVLAIVLLCGAAAAMVGVFKEVDFDKPSNNGGGNNSKETDFESEAPKETYIPSVGDLTCIHEMDSGKVIKQATCAAEGLKVFTCTKCGYTEEESIVVSDQHSYSFKEYSDNEHMKCCTVCNKSTSYEEHFFTESIREATCTVTGSYTYSCVCGYQYIETIPVLGHDVASWVDSGSQHSGICKRSGCGAKVVNEHVYKSEVVVEATCTASGSKTQICEVCGSQKVSSIPKLPHTEVTETVSATCTTDGRTVVSCSVCDLLISNTIIPSYGHSFKMTSDTYMEENNCAVYYVYACGCGEKDDRFINYYHYFVNGVCERCNASDPDYKPCYINGHSWETIWNSDGESIGRECSVCFVTEYYTNGTPGASCDYAGHSWNSGGTCDVCGISCGHGNYEYFDTPGQEHYVCNDCGCEWG